MLVYDVVVFEIVSTWLDLSTQRRPRMNLGIPSFPRPVNTMTLLMRSKWTISVMKKRQSGPYCLFFGWRVLKHIFYQTVSHLCVQY